MAVLQMQRISICGLKKDRKAILEKMQSLGVMEISQATEETEGFEKMDTVNARSGFERKAHAADQALAVLDIYAPQKKSLLSGLEGKALVEREEFSQAVGNKEELIRTADAIIAKSKEIAEAKAAILKTENQIESLLPWLSLDVPMSYTGTEKTSLLIGTVSGDMTVDEMYGKIAQAEPAPAGVDIQVIHSDKDACFLAIICLKADEAAVEEALRSCGFARPSQVIDKKPCEQKELLEAEITKLNTEIKETEVCGCCRESDWRQI